MSEAKDALPLVVLELDTGKREFTDIEEFKEWAQSERQAFEWLNEVARQDGNAAQSWNVYNEWLNQINQFPKQFAQIKENEQQQTNLIKTLKNQTQQAIMRRHLKTSESPDALFVFSLRDSQSATIAGYALNFLMHTNANYTARPALEGAFWAAQYLQGNTETVEAQKGALKTLKRSWAARFGRQHKTLIENNEKLTAEIVDLRTEFTSMKEAIENQFNDQATNFDELVTKSEQELEDIAKTYDEKLALQASVTYWSGKQSRHKKVMIWMGVTTLVFAIGTGVSFSWVAFTMLKETLSETPLWELGIMFAISTFGIWLTRLFAKIFISNLHLRSDSDERVTMIQTYLALLREGNGPNEGERQLILQTLFRPSASGMIKEDGISGFYDLISKSIQK